MVDGILDLLTGILVLGVVLAIAFTFMFSLLREDVMQYESQYQDKAIMSELAYQDDFITNSTESVKKYSYEELMLLLAVQDDRMESPKKINIRNLLSNPTEKIGIWNIELSELRNINLNTFNDANYVYNPNVLTAITHYADNHKTHLGGNIWEITTTDQNVGTITLSSQYGDNIDMMLDELVHLNNSLGYQKEKYYYITYHYEIPNDLKIVSENSNYQVNFDEESLYMIHVYNENIGLDTKDIYEENILNPIKEELTQDNSGKKE